MAAPSGITWGDIVGGRGRLGIYTKLTNTNTTSDLEVQVWFWSKYSVSDSSNTYYYDNLSKAGSATTNRGSKTIKTTNESGSGWSTDNQKLIASSTYSYTRGTSATTRYLYAKISNIDVVGGTVYASKTVSIPALPSYTITYNTNGGSGDLASQKKYYGKALTLRSTKPTRTGYTFSKWNTKSDGTGTSYSAGGTYSKNAATTLYAVWEANTYTVKYNANGGTGAPADQTKTHGVTLKLSTTKPTRDRYNFLGWGTSATATTVSYAAGANYTANTGTTLYAIWALAYVPPRISNLSVSRCNDDKNALVEFDWATDETVSSVKIEWKSSASSDSCTVSATGTSGHVSKTIPENGELSTELSYTVTVTVTDSVDSTPQSKPLSGSMFPIDVLAKGKGVALGKPAETAGLCDIGFKTHFAGGILQDSLPDGTDFDTLLVPNVYYGTAARTYENSPVKSMGIFIEVLGNGGSLMQRVTSNSKDNSIIYERFRYDDAWGDWKRLIKMDELMDIFGKEYNMNAEVTKGANYSSATGNAFLVGNNLRCDFSATRSGASGAGNVTNEVVCSFKITHNGKIKSIYAASFVTGGTGGLASFRIYDQSVTDTEATFNVYLTATDIAITDTASIFTLPCLIDVTAY